MQKINREALKEGMCFSAPVFFDDGVNMFLAEKKPLTKFHLNVLSRWNVLFVMTYGKDMSSSAPADDASESVEELEELEELEEVCAPSFSLLASVKKSLTASQLWQCYTMAMKNMECAYESYRDQAAIDKAVLDQSVNLIYRLVKDDKNFALHCVFCKFDTAAYYPASTVNTTILAAALALDSGFPERTVTDLITAGLLRDLEIFKIPEAVIAKKDTLSVCSAFYTMISTKPHGQDLIAYDAIKALLDAKEKLFGPNSLKAFIRTVGLYPPGTFVLLKDGRIAQVVANNPDYPFGPEVRIFSTDATGRLTDPDITKVPVTDLNADKSVFIIKAVNCECPNAVH